jgi:hypothetical protein
VERAETRIRDLVTRYDKHITIETFQTPPPDRQKIIQAAKLEERPRIQHEWALERAEKVPAEGLYVLICRQPSHVTVWASPSFLATSGFKTADKKTLIDLLVRNFRDSNFGSGLDEGLDLIQKKLEARAALDKSGLAPPSRPMPTPANGSGNAAPKSSPESVPPRKK